MDIFSSISKSNFRLTILTTSNSDFGHGHGQNFGQGDGQQFFGHGHDTRAWPKW